MFANTLIRVSAGVVDMDQVGSGEMEVRDPDLLADLRRQTSEERYRILRIVSFGWRDGLGFAEEQALHAGPQTAAPWGHLPRWAWIDARHE